MSRTYRGSTGLKKALQNNGFPLFSPDSEQMLELSAMHGEVHRFEGIIDRFGSAIKASGIIQTVCVRDLRHCRTGQQLSVDHWWFRVRQEWMQLPLMPGDRVLFTAKVQRCSKGWDLVGQDGKISPGRCQMVGFGSRVRDLLIKGSARRRPR